MLAALGPEYITLLCLQEDSKEAAPVVKPASPLASSKPPKVATFLAKGKPRYDGTNSEGNRFILNEDL